jgi:hypothetical protein
MDQPKAKQKVLTQAQIATVRAWIDQHWTKKECPFHSGPTNWSVGDMPGQIKGLVDEDYNSSLSSFPVVMVHCDTCGFEAYLNAMKIGIVKP